MVQFGFTTLYQTSFKSAFTTVRFIIICNNYKSHWYNINWSFFVSSALENSNAEFGIKQKSHPNLEWHSYLCVLQYATEPLLKL
jgi:hypothetical protein